MWEQVGGPMACKLDIQIISGQLNIMVIFHTVFQYCQKNPNYHIRLTARFAHSHLDGCHQALLAFSQGLVRDLSGHGFRSGGSISCWAPDTPASR